METPPDAIFEQAGMWKEGGTMSFQDIQRVTRIEEDTREKKLQAQAQARQIIAEAQKAGTAAVEAARRQARDQDRKSTRLNSSHSIRSRMPSSA